MQKTINIKITDNGHFKGTLGWLANADIEIRVGTANDGTPCGWLVIDRTPECVACFGEDPDGRGAVSDEVLLSENVRYQDSGEERWGVTLSDASVAALEPLFEAVGTALSAKLAADDANGKIPMASYKIIPA